MTRITGRARVPAVEGFFTMGDEPQLIGGRLETGGYCFPLHLGGSDPRSPAGSVDEVLLSRRGRIWSFTNSAYPPLELHHCGDVQIWGVAIHVIHSLDSHG